MLNKKNKLSSLTITYEKEIDLLKIQAISFSKYVSIDCFSSICVVYNGSFFDEFKRVFDSEIIGLYGLNADRVVLINGSGFAQMPNNRGWYTQQILKILSCDAIIGDHYLSLDTKHFFVRPVDYSSFFIKDKPLAFFHRNDSWSTRFWQGSLQTFGLVDKGEKYIANTPPFIFKINLCKNMIDHFGGAQMFANFFLSNRDITEYFIYQAYLHAFSDGFSGYEASSLQCVGFWANGGSPRTPAEFQSAIARINQDPKIVLVGVHGKRKFTYEELGLVVKVLRNFFDLDELSCRFSGKDFISAFDNDR